MNYTGYFVRANDVAELEQRAGGASELQQIFRSVVAVAGSPWLVCDLRKSDGPPSDDVLEGRASLTQEKSQVLGEIIYLHGDSSCDAFVYEHSRDGVALRKLVWFPMLDDDWTAGWICVQGEPEVWEGEMFFRPDRLSQVLDNERMNYEDRGDEDQFPEREAHIRQLWESRAIAAGDTLPECDATGTLAVERHFGIERPL
jgi:hypothetical protein